MTENRHGRRGIMPSMALRMGQLFGMSADFWMNLQTRWDLYQAEQAEIRELKKIEPCFEAG